MRVLTGFVVTGVLVGSLACSSAPEPTEKAEPAPAVEAAAEPSPDEKVAELDAMCAGAQEAIAARHAATPLYDRLGGRDAIRAVVADTIRRHQVNPQIQRVMEGVDADHLTNQVTDFMSSAFGGDVEYAGRDMVTAHAHLELSNADFLAAGDDLGAAMAAAGVGEDEQQEILCAFVGLRAMAVTR
jgi:hemoglobin